MWCDAESSDDESLHDKTDSLPELKAATTRAVSSELKRVKAPATVGTTAATVPTVRPESQIAMKPAVPLSTDGTERQLAARRSVIPRDEHPLETVKTWLGLTPLSSSEFIDDEDLPDLVVRPYDWDEELDGDWDKYLLKSKTLRWLKDAEAMMTKLIMRSNKAPVSRLDPVGWQDMIAPVGRLKILRLLGPAAVSRPTGTPRRQY